jgi:hypothetical protein
MSPFANTGIRTADLIAAQVSSLTRTIARLHERTLVLLADDVHAKFDAFIADEHGRARDQLANLVLALTAKRTIERIFAVAAAGVVHLRTVRSGLSVMAMLPHSPCRGCWPKVQFLHQAW